MDIQLLKTFLEVYRTRHFGRAADNLYLSQSAVSARIRLLEEELGVSVFTRDRNNIQLTVAGQKLLRYAESISTAWNRARQEMAMGEGGPEPLAVGAVPSLWDIALQDWA
jgi:DNA-binding transcriptional LysR family regulator